MPVVVVSDLGDAAAPLRLLREDVLWCDLAQQGALPCTGCLDCLLRTPGCCPLADALSPCSGRLGEVSLIVLWGRVQLGCFSPAMKAALERLAAMQALAIPGLEGQGWDLGQHPMAAQWLLAGYLPDGQEGQAEQFRTWAALCARQHLRGKARVFLQEDWQQLMQMRSVLEEEILAAGGDRPIPDLAAAEAGEKPARLREVWGRLPHWRPFGEGGPPQDKEGQQDG